MLADSARGFKSAPCRRPGQDQGHNFHKNDIPHHDVSLTPAVRASHSASSALGPAQLKTQAWRQALPIYVSTTASVYPSRRRRTQQPRVFFCLLSTSLSYHLCDGVSSSQLSYFLILTVTIGLCILHQITQKRSLFDLSWHFYAASSPSFRPVKGVG
ncbi:hypothetical protein N657DRAFT_195163 [Parathielavia appendiculata]|uniref:Uncharacterized protein n=1 Tax=Parathielavia appendiculata TaxID=2587402 RepID=A0AAN6U6Y7_9PEZI|nr:hypothetical protein N657DRAFT_195163 [Parathielavia appendiculata]